jgi:predicted negative regulator of RcsB-dependent stress response
MALDLEEQEQVDALKAWWKQYGNITLTALTIFVLGVAGFSAWQGYQAKQTNEAAALFDLLRKELGSNDVKKIRDVGGQLAKANFESGDAKSAKAQYLWVIAHAKQTQSKDLARMRLAVVLLDEKNFSEALKYLVGVHDAAFDPLFNDLKGDVYSLQGKAQDARLAYQAAILALPKDNPFKNYVQLKLDALGEQG